VFWQFFRHFVWQMGTSDRSLRQSVVPDDCLAFVGLHCDEGLANRRFSYCVTSVRMNSSRVGLPQTEFDRREVFNHSQRARSLGGSDLVSGRIEG
jgi:hypothetical protein